MVPKHLRKSVESIGGDQESLMASYIELQGKIKNDKSVLRQPVDTGVRGVRDLMKAVVGGTEELQELLLNECTIIYECKICRNLFRSLANFISHKRIYCIKSFNYFTEATTKQEKEYFQQNDVEPETVKCNKDINLSETKVWLASDRIVPNNIKTEENHCLKPSRRLKLNPLTRKCDIAKIADGLSKRARRESLKNSEEMTGSTFQSTMAERVMITRGTEANGITQAENSTNSSEFFQNSKESASSNHRDSLHLEVTDRLIPGNEAVLQENGTFRVTPQGMQLQDNGNLENFKCSLCETHFMTQQTLTRHVQIHHKERICYPCPICRTYFPSPSSTYRHLSKDHHRTEQQIRRLRPKVLAKARKRKLVDGSSKKKEVKIPESERVPQKSNANVEVLCCDSCGKLFNRRAVLRVHINSCKKVETPKESKDPPSTKSCSSSSSSSSSTNHGSKKSRTKPPSPPSPPVNDFSPYLAETQKSGILVRRDYCKKLNCNTKPLTTCPKTSISENHAFNQHSRKKVNKWKTVLQKLKNKSALSGIENSGDKSDCK